MGVSLEPDFSLSKSVTREYRQAGVFCCMVKEGWGREFAFWLRGIGNLIIGISCYFAVIADTASRLK